MAQPSLSEQVRRLEAELGVPLFVRAGRGLELTEAGRLLRPHAERTLAEAAGGDGVRPRGARADRRDRRLRHSSSAHHYLHRRPGPGLPRHATPACASASSARTRPRSPTRSATASSRPALIVLPVEDAGSTSASRCARSCSTSPPTPSASRQPITIERLAQAPLILADARWARGRPDPPPAARARPAGGRDRSSPQIEVEYLTAALDLAARGLGDTVGVALRADGPRLRAPARHSARSTRRSTRRSPSSPAATPISRPPRASS